MSRACSTKALLAGKIAGQRAILQRHARDRGSAVCREAAERLRALELGIAGEGDVDAVRGVEGSAAAQYFGAFGEMLGEGWSWEGRKHRPAPDPVNAALSFGYALATGEMVRVLTNGGFDTRVGFIHGLRYGRESLALDMVEEFRAPLVDRFVLRLLNRKMLAPSDFEEHDGGSVRLGAAARRLYLEQWEETLAGRAPVLSYEAEEDADTRPAAMRVAREEEDGEGGEGPSWRRRMEVQADRLRRFLMKGEDYVPLTRTVRGGGRRGSGSGAKAPWEEP